MKKLIIATIIAFSALIAVQNANADGYISVRRSNRYEQSGYWAYRVVPVYVEASFIGYDTSSRPVYSPGYWTSIRQAYWVSTPRPKPRVTLGFGIWFR